MKLWSCAGGPDGERVQCGGGGHGEVLYYLPALPDPLGEWGVGVVKGGSSN